VGSDAGGAGRIGSGRKKLEDRFTVGDFKDEILTRKQVEAE
jgi:hypothetical protein